ncbi:MAG: CDGSH iron-sulfur domain-containing protein [Phycisphaerales bacterium]
MARLIRNDQTGPYKIEPAAFPKDGKSIFICACGLSQRLPICDGSHKGCRDEEPGRLYVYEGGTRRVVDATGVEPAAGSAAPRVDPPAIPPASPPA